MDFINNQLSPTSTSIGGTNSKEDTVVKTDQYMRTSLAERSFSILNVHGASSAGGALMVVAIGLLAAFGYAVAKYRASMKKRKQRALINLFAEEIKSV